MLFDIHNSKRISYVLATKNRAEYLKKALSHARSLLGPQDELIVVDGQSRDGTTDIIRDYLDIINLAISEPDSGIPHAYNKGLLLAGGKYIIILFDDDTLNKDAVNKAIEIFERNFGIDILSCGGVKHFNTTKKTLSRPFYYPPGTNYGKKPEDIAKYGACCNGFIIRRSALARAGLFPTDYVVAWDQAFMIQAIYRGCIVKFCRINLFDHYIYEDCQSEKYRYLVKVDRDRFIRTYCSPAYIKKHEFKRLGLNRFLLPEWYLNLIRFYFKKIVSGRSRNNIAAPPEYLWDGGFS